MKIQYLKKFFQKEQSTAYIFMAPALILFITIFIFPIGYVLFTSLFKWNLLDLQVQKTFVGLSNFVDLLSSSIFWRSIWVTVKFVLMSVPVELVLGLCLALLLNRSFKGKKWIHTLMIVPLMVSPIAAYLSWKFLFDPTYGVVNYIIGLFGVDGLGWFSSTHIALFSVAIVDWWLQIPFVFLVLYSALLAVPKDPLEASQVDGANKLQTFWHITFPSIMPIFLVVAIIRIMDAIRVFDNIYVLTKGGPADTTKTVQYLDYQFAFTFFDVGKGSALAIIIVVMIILVGSFLIRQMLKTNEEIKN